MSWRRLALFLGAAAAMLILAGIASNVEEIELSTSVPEPRLELGRSEAPEEDFAPISRNEISASEPRKASDPGAAAFVVGVILGIGVLWFLSKQRIKVMLRKRSFRNTVATPALSEEEQAEAIVEFADTLIDDLRRGDDAGEAIQRCYAAVETGFGKRELRRKPAETPLKYLDRIFGRNKMAADPLTTLTDLFQIARFSQEPVTETMRATAIESLVGIRDAYASVGRKRVRAS